MSMHGDFIGSGIAFPLRVDRQGALALVSHDDDIREAIGVILGTMPGERMMRPQFGCAIHDHVFAGIDGATLGRIDHDVRVALDRWEPRAQVIGVEFDLSERDQGRLLIGITYRIRATNDVRNLVYPFYLVPSEEESS
jgi:Bacteriophage baseplate protein W